MAALVVENLDDTIYDLMSSPSYEGYLFMVVKFSILVDDDPLRTNFRMPVREIFLADA